MKLKKQRKAANLEPIAFVPSRFAISWDKREQLPYSFRFIKALSRHVAELYRHRLPRGKPRNCATIAAKWHKEHPEYKNAVLDVQARRTHLTTGDYAILGLEHEATIERKSKDDLFKTLSRSETRDRFERELARMQDFKFSAVVIESEWSEIKNNPPSRSGLNPKTIPASIIAWQQRFPGTHWWTLPGRRTAEIITYFLLERYWLERHQGHGLEGKGKGNPIIARHSGRGPSTWTESIF